MFFKKKIMIVRETGIVLIETVKAMLIFGKHRTKNEVTSRKAASFPY